MLKITRERKKYRIKSPYDEGEKKIIQERKAEVLKKQKEEEHQKNKEPNTSDTVNKKFVELCKLIANSEQKVQQYEKANEKMEMIREKTFRRRTKKKLTNTINRNKLKQTLIKKDALWKSENVLSKLQQNKQKNAKRRNKKKKTFHQEKDANIDPSKTLQLEIPVYKKEATNEMDKQQNIQDGKLVMTENGLTEEKPFIQIHKKKKKPNIAKAYDKVINMKEFGNNPLQFIKQNVKK